MDTQTTHETCNGESKRLSWTAVGALLTDDDRTRIRHGEAPDFDLSAEDKPASNASAAKPAAGKLGFLAKVRQMAADKMTASSNEVLQAFSDLLQVPGLPPGQGEVLSTTTYAIYRTLVGVRDKETLKQLLPRIEQITAATIEESAFRASQAPGDFLTPEQVGIFCSATTSRTFTIMHTVHGAHVAYELAAAAITGGGSLLAVPFSMTAHAFLVGTMATVISGCAEIYATTSFVTNAGHSDPANEALGCMATTCGPIENRVMLDERGGAWTRTPTATSQQIARRWLAKSAGTGVPLLGKRLQDERTELLVAALHKIKMSEATGLPSAVPSGIVGRHRAE